MSRFRNIGLFFKNHIFSRISSRTALFLVTGCCLVSLLCQYFQRPDAVSFLSIAGTVIVPFQEGINEIGDFLFQTDQEKKSLSEAQSENDRLKDENAELRNKLKDVGALAIENEELRALLFAKARLLPYEYETVEARIIGCDGVNCFNRFTVNKGSMDGIRLNMNVINQDGLVGIVTHVGLNYSVVTSIIEDGVNVSAMTGNGRENCIVSGDLSHSGSGLLVLENALASVDLSEDSTLLTSDISDRFLPGLLIGYARDVHTNDGALTQSGFVRTAVDFTKLHEVLIITTMKEERKEE